MPQVLKDENGRLYKLLGERDEEMRILCKARDEEKRALAGKNFRTLKKMNLQCTPGNTCILCGKLTAAVVVTVFLCLHLNLISFDLFTLDNK